MQFVPVDGQREMSYNYALLFFTEKKASLDTGMETP
jgi:hypothetical protein